TSCLQVDCVGVEWGSRPHKPLRQPGRPPGFPSCEVRRAGPAAEGSPSAVGGHRSRLGGDRRTDVRNRTQTSLIVAAAVALLAVSCSRRPHAGLGGKSDNAAAAPGAPATRLNVVGKWLTPTGGSIEFKADGSATMAGPAGSREVRYRLPDER